MDEAAIRAIDRSAAALALVARLQRTPGLKRSARRALTLQHSVVANNPAWGALMLILVSARGPSAANALGADGICGRDAVLQLSRR
jgi:hypothetical protein